MLRAAFSRFTADRATTNHPRRNAAGKPVGGGAADPGSRLHHHLLARQRRTHLFPTFVVLGSDHARQLRDLGAQFVDLGGGRGLVGGVLLGDTVNDPRRHRRCNHADETHSAHHQQDCNQPTHGRDGDEVTVSNGGNRGN
jgi:hypothetical protein